MTRSPAPDEHARIFGQYDHRRIYGADYQTGCRGLRGRGYRLRREFHRRRAKLYALPADHIYAVYKH